MKVETSIILFAIVTLFHKLFPPFLFKEIAWRLIASNKYKIQSRVESKNYINFHARILLHYVIILLLIFSSKAQILTAKNKFLSKDGILFFKLI